MTTIPSDLAASLSDPYRIEHELGAGGMATVYPAHGIKHDRNLALKVLSPDLAATLREIANTTNLRNTRVRR